MACQFSFSLGGDAIKTGHFILAAEVSIISRFHPNFEKYSPGEKATTPEIPLGKSAASFIANEEEKELPKRMIFDDGYVLLA